MWLTRDDFGYCLWYQEPELIDGSFEGPLDFEVLSDDFEKASGMHLEKGSIVKVTVEVVK